MSMHFNFKRIADCNIGFKTPYAKLAVSQCWNNDEDLYLYFVFPNRDKKQALDDYNLLKIYIPQMCSDFYFLFNDFRCTDFLYLYYFINKNISEEVPEDDEFQDLDGYFRLGIEEKYYYIELDIYSCDGVGANYLKFDYIDREALIKFNQELLNAIIKFTGYTKNQIDYICQEFKKKQLIVIE